MRVSITYLYTIFKYGYPHSVDDALRSLGEIRGLGFRFLEMEGLGREHLQSLYARRAEFARLVSDEGLHVHNFCVVDPEMVSVDPLIRRTALDRFRMGAEVAELLNAETLHVASYAPPVDYLQTRPYQLTGDGGYQFADVPALRLPPGFDWTEVWNALVESCRFCSDVAAEYRRTLIMEPRVGEVICSVDSLLRLIDHVGRPNFKANFDTAHFSAQRENVVLALAKLRGHFANVHISDNNPSNTDHLPIGEGSIDWKEFLCTLHQMGYTGYLGLDLGLTASLLDGYRVSLDRLQSFADELHLPLEI